MAKLETGSNLSNPNTDFTKITPSKKADVRSEQLGTLAKTAAAVGKAVAVSSGKEVSGAGSTQKEINDNATNIAEEINARLTAESPQQDGGQMSPSRVNEIKDEQLSTFAKDDRTLLALRDQGTISTMEARARRTLNLKRALSNPINAMFKGDFLNAANSLTGGGTGAANALFPLTPEEEQKAAIAAEQNKQIAEFEGKIAGMAQSTGLPTEVIRREFQEEDLAQLELKALNRKKQKESLNGEEFSKESALLRNSAARGIYSKINELNNSSGGKGLDAPGMITVERLIDQQYRSMLEAINEGAATTKSFDIGQAQRKTSLENLERWKTGMISSLGVYDAAKLNTKGIEDLKQSAEIMAWKSMPELMYLKTIDPKMIDIISVNGGINKGLDLFYGEGAAASLKSDASRLKGMADFGLGKPISFDFAGVVLSGIMGAGTEAGFEYVTSDSVQNDPAKKVNLKKMYDMAPAVSLQGYATIAAQRMAPENETLRSEMNDAMSIFRTKMDNVKQLTGTQDALIFATEKQFVFIANRGTKGAGPLGITAAGAAQKEWILDLPEAMQEYSGDLTALHSLIRKQPWTWSHVTDNYIDGNDAFNGYMRGEWNTNVSLSTSTEKKSDTSVASQTVSKPADSTLIIRGATPLEGDYKLIPDSTGAYDANEYVLWSKVYNTETKGAKGNKKDAKRIEGILNNPTDEQSENLSRIQETLDITAPKAFAEEIKTSGVSMDEVKSLIALTYAAETSAGTSSSNVSSTGAVGAMQILPSTALSLMTKGTKPFGEEAALLTGFNRDAFINGSPDKRKKMLLTNEPANILFAVAKYFEQVKDTKAVVDEGAK